jgi:hypothetical protein
MPGTDGWQRHRSRGTRRHQRQHTVTSDTHVSESNGESGAVQCTQQDTAPRRTMSTCVTTLPLANGVMPKIRDPRIRSCAAVMRRPEGMIELWLHDTIAAIKSARRQRQRQQPQHQPRLSDNIAAADTTNNCGSRRRIECRSCPRLNRRPLQRIVLRACPLSAGPSRIWTHRQPAAGHVTRTPSARHTSRRQGCSAGVR